MSTVAVVGANGGMGRRYSAILKFLGIDTAPIEVGCNDAAIHSAMKRSIGVIIATPTNTHADMIRQYLKFKMPIFCEKPITKDLADLKNLLAEIKSSGAPFRMVYQYSLLAKPGHIGKSFYNYFRHGTDGLYWDCIQVIGLANSKVTISEDSPVWRCAVNGQSLNIRDMDAAYIGDVQRWLKQPDFSLSQLFDIHQKTAELEKASKNGY